MHLVPACIKVPGRSRREVRLSLFCACNACNIVNILKCRSTGCGLKRRRKLINDQLAWWRHYHQRLLLFSFLFWKLKSRFLFVKTCSWATRIKIFLQNYHCEDYSEKQLSISYDVVVQYHAPLTWLIPLCLCFVFVTGWNRSLNSPTNRYVC